MKFKGTSGKELLSEAIYNVNTAGHAAGHENAACWFVDLDDELRAKQGVVIRVSVEDITINKMFADPSPAGLEHGLFQLHNIFIHQLPESLLRGIGRMYVFTVQYILNEFRKLLKSAWNDLQVQRRVTRFGEKPAASQMVKVLTWKSVGEGHLPFEGPPADEYWRVAAVPQGSPVIFAVKGFFFAEINGKLHIWVLVRENLHIYDVFGAEKEQHDEEEFYEIFQRAAMEKMGITIAEVFPVGRSYIFGDKALYVVQDFGVRVFPTRLHMNLSGEIKGSFPAQPGCVTEKWMEVDALERGKVHEWRGKILRRAQAAAAVATEKFPPTPVDAVWMQPTPPSCVCVPPLSSGFWCGVCGPEQAAARAAQ